MSDSRLDRDLEALRAVSARDVPELDTTIRKVRQRVPNSGRTLWNLRRNIMSALDSIRTRPAVAAVVFGVLLVVAAMVVPVSYQRVVGQDVALTFAGKGIGREEIGPVHWLSTRKFSFWTSRLRALTRSAPAISTS